MNFHYCLTAVLTLSLSTGLFPTQKVGKSVAEVIIVAQKTPEGGSGGHGGGGNVDGGSGGDRKHGK